jgi:hypothetical protein
MKRFEFLPLLLLFGAAGCLPIDLDVNDKGEMLIPRQEGVFLYEWKTGKMTQLPWTGDGNLALARFAPGNDLLLAARVKEGFLGETRVELAPIKGGKPRILFKTSRDISAVQLSPDGTQLAVVQHAGFTEDQMPEIHHVDVKTAAAKVLMQKAVLIRWLADSKKMVVFKIDEKVKDTSNYLGQLGTLDPADAKLTPLASACVDSHAFMAVAPDGKNAIFTAFLAGPAGAKLDIPKYPTVGVYQFDFANAKVSRLDKLDRKIEYARYSPSGKKVLLVAEQKDTFLSEKRDLIVADTALQDLKTVATNSHMPLVRIGGEDLNFPGWLDEDNLFYFSKISVYGVTGHAIHMNHIGADGKNGRDVQPDIDVAVLELTENNAAKLPPKK